ncbi:MAG: UvrD-helicase domain-containing protein [Candidatus Micrarchaeota archaeon]
MNPITRFKLFVENFFDGIVEKERKKNLLIQFKKLKNSVIEIEGDTELAELIYTKAVSEMDSLQKKSNKEILDYLVIFGKLQQEKLKLERRRKKLVKKISELRDNIIWAEGDVELAELVYRKANSELDTLITKTEKEVDECLLNFGGAQKKILNDQRLKKLADFLEKIRSIQKNIKQSQTYLVQSKEKYWLSHIKEYGYDVDESKISQIKEKKIQNARELVKNEIKIAEKFILSYNQIFIEKRVKEYEKLFNKSGLNLDPAQRKAIVVDDSHNLIVAGAGAGKTEVLTTRIAYLIERKPDGIKPERILALAFQNSAAKQIKKRLKEKYGLTSEIRTFHSLGYDILKDAGKRPTLKFENDKNDETVSSDYKKFIGGLFENELKDPAFEKMALDYFEKYTNEELVKTRKDFVKDLVGWKEYKQYMNSLELTALNGKKVKSEEEKAIFNFLLTHKINDKKINVLYEKPQDWMNYTGDDGTKKNP